MYKLVVSSLIAFAFTACAQTNKKTQTMASDKLEAMSEIVTLDTSWTEKVVKTDAEWKKILTSEQYYIAREQGTERP